MLVTLTLLLRWTTALVADPTLLGRWGWFYAVAIGFVLLKVTTDANRTSLHYFYRERLSQGLSSNARLRSQASSVLHLLCFSDAKPRTEAPAHRLRISERSDNDVGAR